MRALGPAPGVRMTHEGFLLRTPSRGVHSLTERITADQDLFTVTHMGLAEVDPAAWRMNIGGLVRRPASMSLADVLALPQHQVTSVHECAGSPLAPTEPKRRVGNVAWSGVRLADVLGQAGIGPDAAYVWSEGLEWGAFAGLTGEPFVKDLPLGKALAPEVLLAVAMNGIPLTPERGGPVRLVVPGWYGTNSVKWLGHLTLADRRAPGPFTTRFYNDPTPDGPRPVWAIAPESVLVQPAPDAPPPAGRACTVQGWAWAEAGVAKVEVSTDGGKDWADAVLEPPDGFAWQRFTRPWTPGPGRHRLLCRCTDARGAAQPAAGARNAVHMVEITVA
jgi:DMSO/TMAO reductase YedYZ molybdopterin-dependent catalytic subunit